MNKILIIKEEKNARIILEYDLLKAGFDVEGVQDSEEGLVQILNSNYDLIILDWNMSEKKIEEFINEVKTNDIKSMIIAISEHDNEKDILNAFALGVDDFIGGSFSSKVLIARIKAKLKRMKRNPDIKQFLDLELNDEKRKLFIVDEQVNLTKKEFELIKYFMINNNIVLSRNRLLNDLWGYDYDGDTRIVDVYIFNLRVKLKNSKAEIESSRGIGYILKEKLKDF